MNKRIFIIAKKSFKEKFAPFSRNKVYPGLPKNYFLRILFLILSYIFLIGISYGISSLFSFLFLKADTVNEYYYFAFSTILVIITIILFSSYEIISDFYISKDNKIMLTMPIKEEEIFVGRFLGNVFSALTYYIFWIVIMLVYFTARPFNIFKLLISFLAFVPVILISYSFVSLVVMLIMRFTNVRKYKQAFKFIGYSILALLFGLYYYFIFSFNGDSFDPNSFDQIINYLKEFADKMINILYPAKLFAKSIADLDMATFGFLLILTIISLFIIKVLASKIYFASLIESESYNKRKKTKKKIRKSYKKSSQLMAIAKKEISSVIKNPVFMFNQALLLVMVIALSINFSKEVDMEIIKNYLPISNIDPIFLVGGISMAGVLFANGVLPFTSLSREGKSFYLSQTLPIDPSANFLGRALGIYFLNFIVSIFISLLFFTQFKLTILQLFLFFLGMLVGGIWPNFYGLLFGTKKIYTSWEKPSEVTKTGIYGFLMSITSLILSAIMFGSGFLLYMLSKNLLAAVFMILIVSVILSLILYLMGVERYRKGFFDVD